ncbi:MAG: nuclear transport factor 2 family protein [Actinomycetia bacterium]|nr:nuclear transport factor 2 family protein [Actinomycetes bacterium]
MDAGTAIARLLDESAIRDATSRFADAATHADYDAFRTLWADDADWVIGSTEDQPFERRVHGVDGIVDMLRTLRSERDYFVQFAVTGSIEIDGDTASARCICLEAARGPGEAYYRNTGVWFDHLRRTENGWVFTNRTFQYLWVDFTPFTGDVFPRKCADLVSVHMAHRDATVADGPQTARSWAVMFRPRLLGDQDSAASMPRPLPISSRASSHPPRFETGSGCPAAA